jgi:hypothetical protein
MFKYGIIFLVLSSCQNLGPEIEINSSQGVKREKINVDKDNEKLNDKLKEIHTLVNSDMTSARQSELDQTRLTLVMLRKIVRLIENSGAKVGEEDLKLISETEIKIKDLELILADRMEQMKIVERENKFIGALR